MFVKSMIWRWLLLSAGICAVAGGCAKAPGGKATSPSSSQPSAKQYEIAVVPKSTSHDFWMTVKAGADAAGEEFGAEILWKGPAQETDIAGQVNILQDFITQKVDAIVMAACDSRGLVETVKRAEAASIPVVTVDSGIDPDVSRCFVATDNIAGAKIAAKTLAELVGGKGEVGLIPFVPGAATSIMREKGFKEGIAELPDIRLVATLYSQSQVEKGRSVTEDMLTAHPNIKGIFACNESGAMGCARALESRGAAGKVKLVAFDGAPDEVAALKKGTIQALIVQNPFRMGHDGVAMAVKVLKAEKIPKRVDTGVTVITKDNLEEPKVQELLNPPRP